LIIFFAIIVIYDIFLGKGMYFLSGVNFVLEAKSFCSLEISQEKIAEEVSGYSLRSYAGLQMRNYGNF